MVDTSPMLRTGSLSRLETWKFSWKHVLICGSIDSAFLKPITFLNSSMVIILSALTTGWGLSIGRICGGSWLWGVEEGDGWGSDDVGDGVAVGGLVGVAVGKLVGVAFLAEIPVLPKTPLFLVDRGSDVNVWNARMAICSKINYAILSPSWISNRFWLEFTRRTLTSPYSQGLSLQRQRLFGVWVPNRCVELCAHTILLGLQYWIPNQWLCGSWVEWRWWRNYGGQTQQNL